MNERIKELYEQAHEHMPITVLDPETCKPYHKIGNGGKPMLYYRGLNPEKFAELIVRECASQVRFTDLLKCNDDSDGEILLQASVQLKQHFGVEL